MLAEMYIGGVALLGLSHLTFNYRKDNKIQNEIAKSFNNVMSFNLNEGEEIKFKLKYYILNEYGFDLIIGCDGGDLNDFRNFVKRLEYEYEASIIAYNIEDGIRVKVWLNGFKATQHDEIMFKFDKAFDTVRNGVDDTFNIVNIKDIKTPNGETIGYTLDVDIPPGLSFYLLKKFIGNIDSLGRATVVWNGDDKKASIELIVNNSISLNYEPIQTEPYQLYVGVKGNYEPIILDYNKNANGFIVGKPTTGKTRVMMQGILNAMQYNNDMELYIAASDKKDLEIFKNTKFCTECTNSLEDILEMLKRLNTEVKRRNNAMPIQDMIFDIYAYNKKAKDKWNIIHFLSDEVSDLMVNGDDDSNYKIKKAITDILIEIGRKGRSVGVYLTLASQRAGSSCINPDLKALLGNKIVFQQQNEQSIKLVVGHEDMAKIRVVSSLNMERREFMYETDGYGVGKACVLTDDTIRQYMSPYIIKKDNVVQIKTKKKCNSGRYSRLKKV